ncbi:MAG: hypothetical protein KVP17_000008, partial [Porospora cf. gigantea B]|uniref:uncharacterized protein n=2 Tax=Porospora cf. gigantea B TaxID=2853592 RepID=UPI0035718372
MPAVAAVKTSLAPPAKLDPIALKPARLPKLLLFIPGPHEQSTASARQLMRSLGWQHCVEEVDCSIHTAKAEHLASLIDRPAVPYLFFQGKTVGNLDHLNEMVLSGGFQKLANMYERWVDSGFSPLVGCECGFQLHLDPKLCLVETDVKTLGASVTSDPDHAACPVFAVPNITCDSAFCPGVNFESLTTLEILCDLLLDFAFEFVTTNKPAPTFSIIPRRITHRRSFSGKTLREYAESRYRTDSLTATNVRYSIQAHRFAKSSWTTP